jgi:type IV pilus assembly protein PilX
MTRIRMRAPPHAQRGVSLIVSLILLVIVTLLALGSMRGVVLQTRMSGSTHDRSLAFEAAEAALRTAERRAAGLSASDFPGAGCANGLCVQPALADTPRWQDDAFGGWQASVAQVPANAPTPDTFIEDMGDAPNWAGCENEVPRQPNCSTRRFRISSRSTADGRASVLVQSQYAAP